MFLTILLFLGVVGISGCTDTNNQKNLTYDKYKNDILPKIIEYNKSKGVDNSNISVKGETLLIANPNEPIFSDWLNSINKTANLTENYIYFNDTNATLFVIVDQQRKVLESGTYISYMNGINNGEVQVDSSQLITDIVVIYYPSLEIAGWHRVYGGIPEALKSSYENDEGPYGGSNISEWIKSLPGFKALNTTNHNHFSESYHVTATTTWDTGNNRDYSHD